MTVIIVSGTRLAGDEHLQTLVQALFPYGVGGGNTLVHGAARGVDSLAAELCTTYGWQVVAMPAEWQRCSPDVPEDLGGCPPRPHLRTRRSGGVYCPNAGPARNQRMVDREPRAELAVCFPLVGSRGRSGTWDLAYRAADAGIHVQIFPLQVVDPAVPLLPASVEEVTP